jgi:hypothetical protein
VEEVSEDKTDMVLPPPMLQQARVALAAVGSLGVEGATVDLPVHQIATGPAVGMIHVVGVAHTMTEAVVIAATNVMDLHEVVRGAIWSR